MITSPLVTLLIGLGSDLAIGMYVCVIVIVRRK